MIRSTAPRRSTPSRVALTGANGGYGRTLLDQLRRLPDMAAVQLVDPDVAGVGRMLADLGVDPARIATPASASRTAIPGPRR